MGFLIACVDPGAISASDTYIAPQFDLYVTHNNTFRSHAIVSGNWLTSKSAFASAWWQYDIDFSLMPYFRRYLFKDPNVEKSKLITMRLGFLKVSDLKDDPNGFDEKRPFAEVTFRFPMGRAWLAEDRNRGEYRIFNKDETARYRNRLRVERNVVIRKVRLTPYGSTEIFYDNSEKWNEVQGALGLDVPRGKFVFEVEGMGQFVEGDLASFSVALNAQLHI